MRGARAINSEKEEKAGGGEGCERSKSKHKRWHEKAREGGGEAREKLQKDMLIQADQYQTWPAQVSSRDQTWPAQVSSRDY